MCVPQEHHKTTANKNKEAKQNRKSLNAVQDKERRAAPSAPGTAADTTKRPEPKPKKIKLRNTVDRIKLDAIDDANKYKPPNCLFHQTTENPPRLRIF